MKPDKEDLFSKYPNLSCVRHKDLENKGIFISYSNRCTRLSANEIRAVYEYFNLYALDYTEEIRSKGLIDLNLTFTEHFFTCNSMLSLEIGFGQAENVLDLAKKNPNINFFAIDVFLEGFARAIKIASEERLNNILFCHYDALDFIRHSLRTEILDFLYILFPDPWPKNKQKKRRLLNKENLNLFVSLLKKGGIFIFATDIYDYAKSTEENLLLFPNLQKIKDENQIRLLRPTPTHYEKKAIDENRNIYNLIYKKLI